jgi:predicted RNase H-like HicB family nuclease
MKLTTVINEGEEFFIGAIKEIPAVLTQGKTVEETNANVLDLSELYDNSNKILVEDLIIF